MYCYIIRDGIKCVITGRDGFEIPICWWSVPLDLAACSPEVEEEFGGCFLFSYGVTMTDGHQSYACGSINFFGWIAICAGICIIIPQLVLGMVVFYHETFEIKAWHSFLIYQALNFIVLVYNLFVLRRAAWTHDIGCKSRFPRLDMKLLNKP
jgi:hypothetical protein